MDVAMARYQVWDGEHNKGIHTANPDETKEELKQRLIEDFKFSPNIELNFVNYLT